MKMVTTRKPKGKLRELETERYILSTLPVLWLPLYRKDGSSFISADGFGHLATVTGATWGLQGRTGDGVDDEIVVPAHASLTLSTAFSIGCWCKTPRVTGAGGHEHLVGKMDGASDVFAIYQDQNDGGVSGHVRTSSGYSFPLIYAAEHQNFHHIFITFDSNLDSNQVKTFHNGELITQATLAGTMVSNATIPVTLLRTNDDARPLQGTIGDVWWYVGMALTTSEIQQIYLATKWRYQ